MKTKHFALVLAFASFGAFAQTAPVPNRVDQRQANQEARIQQGVQSGSLTANEAARLEKGQNRIDKMEAKATADGKVTRKEKARLEHAQDVQSRHIAKQSHDRQHDRNHDGKKDRQRRH